MLKLLVIGSIAIATALGVRATSTPPAEAIPLEIFMYIYHPTGWGSTRVAQPRSLVA